MSRSDTVPVARSLVAEMESGPLAPLASRTAFPRGHVIGTQGTLCTSLHVIIRGKVLLSRVSPERESTALYLLGAGDIFGEGMLAPDQRWMLTATAATDVSLLLICQPNLRRIIAHRPALGEELLALMAARLERAHRRAEVSSAPSARERVLAFLTLMSDYHGRADGDLIWLPLGLSQTQIGEMVGLTRETVARVLAALEEEGLVRRAQRKGYWLRLPDDVVLGGLLLAAAAASPL